MIAGCGDRTVVVINEEGAVLTGGDPSWRELFQRGLFHGLTASGFLPCQIGKMKV